MFRGRREGTDCASMCSLNYTESIRALHVCDKTRWCAYAVYTNMLYTRVLGLYPRLNMRRIHLSIAVAAFVATLSAQAVADQMAAVVDIYSGFDLSNPRTGAPYSNLVGQYSALVVNVGKGIDFDIDFGTPFGLTDFVAVVDITFSAYEGGYYFCDVNSSSPFGWNNSMPIDVFPINGWQVGNASEEIFIATGTNSLIFDYIHAAGVPEIGASGIVYDGTGYDTLHFDLRPWGGAENPYEEDVYVSDSTSTLAMLGSALLGFVALRRRRIARYACW